METYEKTKKFNFYDKNSAYLTLLKKEKDTDWLAKAPAVAILVVSLAIARANRLRGTATIPADARSSAEKLLQKESRGHFHSAKRLPKL